MAPVALGAATAARPAPQKPPAAAAPCKCKRNRCIRRYCPCFARGTFCSAACACSGCRNRKEFMEEVRSAIVNVRKRYKDGFGAKTVPRDGATGRREHRRGCKCQRSRCLKRYCECFEAGVACAQHCKCEGCANPHGVAPPREQGEGGGRSPQPSGRGPRTGGGAPPLADG